MNLISEFKPQAPDPRLGDLLADYPVSLFSPALYQSIELADRYCLELTIDLLDRLEVLPQLDRCCSVEDLCGHFNFSPRFHIALTWLLDRLVAADMLAVREQSGSRHYQLREQPPQPALAQLRALGLAIDPANVATLDLLDAAAAIYPTVARGECSGEEALFGAGNIALWLAYFNNDNPLYAVNNWLGAMAVADRLSDKPNLRILEIGAGAGSASEALLSVLAERNLSDRIERYLITEPSPFFRRRSERRLKTHHKALPLEFLALDIDRPWAAQGAGEGIFDIVCGVNVLHVAHDLAFSLAEARAALAPDGWLVAGECLRPFPGQPIYIELVFQILDSFINVLTHPQIRPNPGFITPEQWRLGLTQSGFKQIQVIPDHQRIRQVCPYFFIGVVCGC